MDNKSPLEYLVNFSTLQNFILNLACFLLYINDLPVTFIMKLFFILIIELFPNCTKFLICGSSFYWLWNLNLVYNTLHTAAGSSLLTLFLGKPKLLY